MTHIGPPCATQRLTGRSPQIAEDANAKPYALKAVKLIADKRNSNSLRNWLETGSLEETEMDIGIAYAKFDIQDRTIDDDFVLATYETAISDYPDKIEDFNKAINAIATARESSYMQQTLRGKGVSVEIAAQDWPVGLENIGNTCYLYSLLQYLFTVSELRNLILNFDTVRMDLGSAEVASKRVGSRHISVPEIVRAQKCKSCPLQFG